MHPEIPEAAVAAALANAPTGPVGACYRFRLASALRASPGLLSGVERELIADVLGVCLSKTWRTPLHPNEEDSDEPFAPTTIFRDGRRTFLPADLEPEDEDPLRALASSNNNPFVRGAIFDVLWTRFNNHEDARAAADARVASAALIDMSAAWFDATVELIRAGLLALQVGDKVRLGDVGKAVERAGARAAAGARPFVGVANDLATVLLADRKVAKTIGAHGERWAVATLFAAAQLDRERDHHQSEDALLVAAALFAGAGKNKAAQGTRAQRIERLMARGRAAGGMIHAHLVQLALDEAIEAGLSELATKAKAELQGAINAATAQMKGVGVDIRLPPDLATVLHEAALRTPEVSHAIRSLAASPWLTSIPVESLTAAAEEEAKHAVFLHLVPSALYRDHKVAALRATPEEKSLEAVSRHASLYLAHVELAAEHFLGSAFPRFQPDTLFRSLQSPSWLDTRRVAWFARASERFAAQDFGSCGTILLTQYEGVLRDLARAAGHHAYRYKSGITSDELLNSLLRQPSVRKLLGEEHAWFVEYFLCRSDMGRNLRNELAHGNLDMGELRPGVVFLLWMLVLRLTMFDVTDDADPTEAGVPETAHDAEVGDAEETGNPEDVSAAEEVGSVHKSDHAKEAESCDDEELNRAP